MAEYSEAATVATHAGHDLDDGWCHTCCVQEGDPAPRRCPECRSPEMYYHKSHCSQRRRYGQYLPDREAAGKRIAEIKAHAAWLEWDRWAQSQAKASLMEPSSTAPGGDEGV